MLAMIVPLLAAAAAWLAGDAEFVAPYGIGSYAEMHEAIDRVDVEARAWLDGMAHATGFRERQLEAAACKLWCFTASPEPLEGVPRFAMSAPGRWATVVTRYRRLVRDAEELGEPVDVFLRRNLKATAAASGGPRQEQAWRVLRWWVPTRYGYFFRFRRGEPVAGSVLRGSSMSPAGRRAIHRLMVSWFDRHEQRLEWDADRRQFTGPGRWGLPNPTPEEKIHALAAEERAKDAEEAADEPRPGPKAEDGLPPDAVARELAGHGVPPLVYDPDGKPDPLGAKQVETVHHLAVALQPKGRHIWFVFVAINYQVEGVPQFDVVVYYTPDQAGDRLRRGRCAHLGSGESLRTYAQVPPPGTTFRDALAVPTVAGLPARVTGEIDDADLVAIVDAARGKLADADAGEPGPHRVGRVERAVGDPPQRKPRKPGGVGDAFWVVLPSQGRREGVTLKVKRTAQTFRVVEQHGGTP